MKIAGDAGTRRTTDEYTAARLNDNRYRPGGHSPCVRLPFPKGFSRSKEVQSGDTGAWPDD